MNKLDKRHKQNVMKKMPTRQTIQLSTKTKKRTTQTQTHKQTKTQTQTDKHTLTSNS